jgi:ribosomal protein S18 acetylase RimI-like enzyme
VEPGFRKQGIAALLLSRGEEWMTARGLPEAATYTDENNVKLINLYFKHGYQITDMRSQMVRLAKSLSLGR